MYFILLKKKIMDLLSLFQLLVIMNWLFLFLSFNNNKNILVIAIVSLQFILLQYSCAPFFLTKKVIVGTRFSNRAHYNEFVENGSKSWALMRRRLVLGVKNTQNRAAQRPREKGPFARGLESPSPLASLEPLPFS